MSTQIIFIVVCGLGLLLIAAATHFFRTRFSGQHSNPRLWGDGQAWDCTLGHKAGNPENPMPMYRFQPELWRKGKKTPSATGFDPGVLKDAKGHVIAIVDTDDIHAIGYRRQRRRQNRIFFYTPISSTHWPQEHPFYAQTQKEIYSVTMPGLPRKTTASRFLSWIFEIQPDQTGEPICSI